MWNAYNDENVLLDKRKKQRRLYLNFKPYIKGHREIIHFGSFNGEKYVLL